MSKPITIDLTARAAAEYDARRAALLAGDLGIDIIVVDDQPDHESGWFAGTFPAIAGCHWRACTSSTASWPETGCPTCPTRPTNPSWPSST